MKTRPSASFFFVQESQRNVYKKRRCLLLAPMGIKRLEGQRDFAY